MTIDEILLLSTCSEILADAKIDPSTVLPNGEALTDEFADQIETALDRYLDQMYGDDENQARVTIDYAKETFAALWPKMLADIGIFSNGEAANE